MPPAARLAAPLFALALTAGPTLAQQGWRGYERGGIVGAGACPMPADPVTGNFACIIVDCAPRQAIRYGLDIQGGDVGDRFTGTLSVDGQPYPALEFNRLPGDWLTYRALHLPDLHNPLFAALKAGRTVSLDLTVEGGGAHSMSVGLSGSTRALAGVERACPNALRAAPLATPETAPERFVRFDAATTPEALAEARAALAAELADNDRMLRQMGAPAEQRVEAVLGHWPDGRRLLLAQVWHDTTAVYGMAGGTSRLYAAAPGGPWIEQIGGSAIAVWFDSQTAGRDGWPDLAVQVIEGGMSIPFIRWSWDGARYQRTGG